MLYDISSILDKGIVVKKCRPRYGIGATIEKLKRANGVVQIFDASSIISVEHIILAYANAVLSFMERRNRSKSIGMEMMCYAALTMQIDKAIEICGAHSNDIVLFADGKDAYKSVKRLFTHISDLKEANKKAYKKLGVKSIEELAEKMALLSISD